MHDTITRACKGHLGCGCGWVGGVGWTRLLPRFLRDGLAEENQPPLPEPQSDPFCTS